MKILFITSTYLGDAIISSGILEALRRQHPQARFTIACGRVPLPLFEAMPQVEKLIPIDKESYGRHWLKLWGRCVGTFWDLVVDGRGTGLSYFLLTKKRLIWRGGQAPILKVRQLSKWLGIDPTPPSIIHLTIKDEEMADQWLQGRPVICLSPAANWDKKCWPLESFSQLGKKLIEKEGPYPGSFLAVLGAPGQRQDLEPLFQSLPSERTLDWVGKMPLRVLAAILKRTTLFVGNDSGLMHMAATMGTPTFGLFGPSDDRVYGPWSQKGYIIRAPVSFEEAMTQARAGGFPMETLSVERVLQEIKAKEHF